jgi:hypothetical protein
VVLLEQLGIAPMFHCSPHARLSLQAHKLINSRPCPCINEELLYIMGGGGGERERERDTWLLNT